MDTQIEGKQINPRLAPRSGIEDVIGRLAATLMATPACAVCDKAPASIGWMVDPTGRVSGRCSFCAENSTSVRGG